MSSSERRMLFLGISGVITTSRGLVPYASPFVHWATTQFRVAWLTSQSPAEAFALARRLGLSEDAVSYAGLSGSRVDAVLRFQESILVDVPLPSTEAARLGGRFLATDPRVGVTPMFRAELLQCA